MGLPVWRAPSPVHDEAKNTQKPARSPIRRTVPNRSAQRRHVPRRHVSVFASSRRPQPDTRSLEQLQSLVDAGEITDPNLISAIARNSYLAGQPSGAGPRTMPWLPEEDQHANAASRFAASPLPLHEDPDTDFSSSSEDLASEAPEASEALPGSAPLSRMWRTNYAHLQAPASTSTYQPRYSPGWYERERALRQTMEVQTREDARVAQQARREALYDLYRVGDAPSASGRTRREMLRYLPEPASNSGIRNGVPRSVLDRPIPSTFSEGTQPPTYRPTLDGPGDRSHSPLQAGSPTYSPGSPQWAHWENLLQTITPDEHLPTPDSSFTSAAASASFAASRSQSATSNSQSDLRSATSSRTSLSTDTSQGVSGQQAHTEDYTCDTDAENPSPSLPRPAHEVGNYPRIVQTADATSGSARRQWLQSAMDLTDRQRIDARERTARRRELLETPLELDPEYGVDGRETRLSASNGGLSANVGATRERSTRGTGTSRNPPPYLSSNYSPYASTDRRRPSTRPNWSRRIPRSGSILDRPIIDETELRPLISTATTAVPDGPLLPDTWSAPSNTDRAAVPATAESTAAGGLSDRDLDSLRPIMERLASRDDIPEEWWQSVGLSPIFAREVVQARSRGRTRGSGGEVANL